MLKSESETPWSVEEGLETWGFGGESKLNRKTRVRIFRLCISSLSVKAPIDLTRCGLPWSISSASRHWKEHSRLLLNLLAQLGWGDCIKIRNIVIFSSLRNVRSFHRYSTYVLKGGFLDFRGLLKPRRDNFRAYGPIS